MRYPVLEFRSTSQTDHRTFFQYYGLTIFTVFFYDYLLTLEDEVRQEAPSPQPRPLTEAAPPRSNISGVEGRRGVRALPAVGYSFC